MPGITLLNGYSQDWTTWPSARRSRSTRSPAARRSCSRSPGGCGLGALDAAKEHQAYGIGVDADQSFLGPHVITSALKRVDSAVFLTIQSIVDGTWQGGRNQTYGLADDGVGLGKTGSDVPLAATEAVDAAPEDRRRRDFSTS